MTDTEAALLRAIAAQPDDDTARLVYADYLDETGEAVASARAEFVRLQVRSVRTSHHDPEWVVARRRMDQLLLQWDGLWNKDVPPGFRVRPGYRRGFLYRAAASASAVAATDDPRALLIEHLELKVDVSATRLREVVKQPLFASLTELTVRGDLPVGWAGAKALAEGSYPRLDRLDLSGQRIGDLGVRWLCGCWSFPRLGELNIRDNEITEAGAAALISSGLYARLRRVTGTNNPVGPAMAERLRNGRHGW